MAAAKDTNIFIAKGRVYDILGPATFALHVRPDRNGRPRNRRREADNPQPAAAQAVSVGTGIAAEVTVNGATIITQTGDEGQVRAVTVSPRARRSREDPDGIIAMVVLGHAMDLRRNDEIEIRGHVEARAGYSRVWERFTYQQDLVADEVKYSKPRIEELTGVHAGFYTGPDHFEACFSGIVTEVKKESGWVNLTLEVRDGAAGRRASVSTIRVQYSVRARINNENVEKGDEIFVVTSLTTRKKEVAGEMRRFMNFHVEDLHIIKKAASSGDAESEAEAMFAALDDDFDDVEETGAEVPSVDADREEAEE